MLIVGGGEKMAAFHRDMHNVQIIRLHVIHDCHGKIALVRRLGFADEPEVFFIVAAMR